MEMASENETVAEIVSEMRGSTEQRYCSSKHCSVKVFNPILDFADRIEAAYGREVMLQNKRLEHVVEDSNRTCGLCESSKKILELRKCLKEAIDMTCENNGTCSDCPIFGETHGDCDVYRWRKALEG